MRPSQDRLFAEFEGDRWFRRNRDRLERFDPAADLPLRILDLYDLKPRSVVEIGACDGFRLAEMVRRYGARAVAVEPSHGAIQSGRRRFAQVEFVRGQAHGVPLKGAFDLVVVNFVFHWLDRDHLLAAAAEADRLLADGGYLLLGDFCPANRVRTPYHHLPDQQAYTYKQDYGAIFRASGLYHPVCFLASDHGSRALNPAAGEQARTGVWLLRKRLEEHYVERPHGP
jgi:SAM-dependent methyltransferase